MEIYNHSLTLESFKLLNLNSKYGENIRVAIIDGEVDINHKSFSKANIEQRSTKSNKPTQHGTAVADLILNIAPSCTLVPITAFSEQHNGKLKGCSEVALAKGIKQAIDLDCDVINISGAALSSQGLGDSSLRESIDKCEELGILVIAAVGNEGMSSESVPAALPSVLSVGACDNQGTPMTFNNHGKKLRKKTILAPGLQILVAKSEGGSIRVSGNSFSAPIITGTAVHLIKIFRVLNTDRKPKDIIKWFMNTAVKPSSQNESCGQVMAGIFCPTQLVSALITKYPKDIECPPLNETNERGKLMQETTETNIEALVPEITSSAIEPANVSMDTKALEQSTLESANVDLPKITDAAQHNHVHANTSQNGLIAPQDFDLDDVLDEKVFAVGSVGYDFGTEARLDYFTQVMTEEDAHPFDPLHMSKHLNTGENMDQATALIWTLKIDGIPVYAIEPTNQFAVLQYMRLSKFLTEQQEGAERISIAGSIIGETRLFNGQIVPTISPVLRGMFNWKTDDLVKLVTQKNHSENKQDINHQIGDFLNRIYYELRNKGQSSQERAINYSAVNAYQMKEVFEDAISEGLFLNRISAEKSPICRPESDCWDVILEFFNPKERLNAAKKLYRYTIDVSDIMPVTVGDLRSWHAY